MFIDRKHERILTALSTFLGRTIPGAINAQLD